MNVVKAQRYCARLREIEDACADVRDAANGDAWVSIVEAGEVNGLTTAIEAMVGQLRRVLGVPKQPEQD